MNHNPPIIFFDGVCNLCSWGVQFMIRRDHRKRFKFAMFQAPKSQELLAPYHIEASSMQSVILLLDGKIYQKSTAILQIAKLLGGFWSSFYYLFIGLPKPCRDKAYDFISNHRYRWFGKKTECWLVTPELQDRFI